jgi:mannose-6-phosphate isomerase
MEMDQGQVNERLQPLLDEIIPLYQNGKLFKGDEQFWAARAALTFNTPGKIDRGIFSVYIFNLVQLKKGEAIFQDAGVPHAYLEGQNVEIMANSDNVLRGGLTSKHIDVAELLKHVKIAPLVPAVIAGVPSGNKYEKLFLTPAEDFELRVINLESGDSTFIHTGAADIFFVYSGNVTVGSDTESLERESGESFLAASGATLTIRSETGACIYRATVPGT